MGLLYVSTCFFNARECLESSPLNSSEDDWHICTTVVMALLVLLGTCYLSMTTISCVAVQRSRQARKTDYIELGSLMIETRASTS
jgi:hypothetical protein